MRDRLQGLRAPLRSALLARVAVARYHFKRSTAAARSARASRSLECTVLTERRVARRSRRRVALEIVKDDDVATIVIEQRERSPKSGAARRSDRWLRQDRRSPSESLGASRARRLRSGARPEQPRPIEPLLIDSPHRRWSTRNTSWTASARLRLGNAESSEAAPHVVEFAVIDRSKGASPRAAGRAPLHICVLRRAGVFVTENARSRRPPPTLRNDCCARPPFVDIELCRGDCDVKLGRQL